MKKIYLTLGLALALVGANAQQTLKIKNPLAKGNKNLFAKGKKGANARNNGHNSVAQVTGGIVCNTNYVAGTTMDLSLTIDLTNTDGEYGDSLAITFPAGITPNSSPNNPFPTLDMGAGYFPDALNPVVGQTISWGLNDNGAYGGISSGLGAINFTVNVTIGSGVTGTQTVGFYVSGDTYPTTGAGDLSGGTFPINPATANDLKALGAYSGTACGLTYGLVELVFKNVGLNAATNFPIKYKVNGGTVVSETYTATVNPGDTVSYIFNTPVTVAANTSYTVVAYGDISSDGNTSDDTAKTAFAAMPYNVPYTTGFENSPAKDLSGWSMADVDGSGITWDIDTQIPFGGTNDMYVLENDTSIGDNWLFSPCLNITTGGIYKLKYAVEVLDLSSQGISTAGSLGIFLGDSAAPSRMTMTISPTTAIATSTTYTSTSVTFTATTTGNLVLGFEATNNVNGANLAMFLDNINLTKTGTVAGIATFSNNDDLAVYPNPTTGLLNITTTANTATVEVYNLMGQVVLTKQLNNGNNTIDISNLSNGVYSMQIMQNNTLTVGKVIKTN